MSDGGGREDSDEWRDKSERVGEPRAGIYGRYVGASVVVGSNLGAVSSIDGDCARGKEEVDEEGRYERYVRREEEGLGFPGGEPCFLKCTRAVTRRLGYSIFLPTWAEEDHWEDIALASS